MPPLVYIGSQINLNPKQVWGGFIGGGFSSRDGVVGGVSEGVPPMRLRRDRFD